MIWLFVGPVGIYLLNLLCSGILVLFTVESLSLLCLLVISWFICSRRWCFDKLGVFHANQISMSWSTSEIRVRLAPWNQLNPSSKIFYWPFQGSTSFVDFFMFFFLSRVCYAFARVCLYVYCGYLLGKVWPLGSRLWCQTVSLSLSHWYPGSGVVLDCIDSWSFTLIYFKTHQTIR